ncbi:MAG: transglycosylase SLT domain-containing protein [Thiolinea sp.]
MDKLNKMTAGWLFLFTLVLTSIYSSTALAAGCQVLSRSTLEKKADPYEKTIRSASHRYGVSADLIKAVITVESCFRRKARGSLGEKGLMQLMPGTARRFNVKRGYNSWENVHGGTRYLGYLLDRYNGDKQRAIAAYNAGEGNVKPGRRIRNIDYVNKVMHAYHKLSGSSKKAVKTSTRPAAATRNSKTRTRSQGRHYFHVKRGHTVYEVMRQTGVSVDDIIRLNGLKAPFHIKTGQRLRLR